MYNVDVYYEYYFSDNEHLLYCIYYLFLLFFIK